MERLENITEGFHKLVAVIRNMANTTVVYSLPRALQVYKKGGRHFGSSLMMENYSFLRLVACNVPATK
jgi:hypothetical protein